MTNFDASLSHLCKNSSCKMLVHDSSVFENLPE